MAETPVVRKKPMNTMAKHFHCPAVLVEGKFLPPTSSTAMV